MIIKYLELENYRRFQHVKLELPSGIIGIIGLNGAGKSTLVEAVAWALYGNQPQITRTKKGDVKRSGTTASDPCRVVLEFVMNGDNYRLIREIKGAGQTIHAELAVNGVMEATGAKDTTALLERRLGMDYKSFFASVFARQKELNALSSEALNVRKKLVLRMLNIEFLEKVKQKIGSEKRAAAHYLEGVQQSLTDSDGKDILEKLIEEQSVLHKDLTALRSDIEKLEKTRTEKEENYKKFEKSYSEYSKKNKDYQAFKVELDDLVHIFTRLNTRLEGLEKDRYELEKDEKELVKLTDNENKYNKLLSDREELEKARDKHNRLEGVLEKIKGSEKKLEDFKTRKENFSKQLDFFKSIDSDLEKIKANRGSIEAALTELNDGASREKAARKQLELIISEKRSHQKNIQELGPDSKCPTCERQLDQHYDFLMGKFDTELTTREREVKAVESKLKDIEAEKEKIQQKKKDLEKKNEELLSARQKRDEVKTTLSNIEGDIKSNEKEIEKFKAEQNELGEDKFDPDKYEALKNELSELSTAHDMYVAVKKSVERLPGIKADIDSINAELKVVNGKKKNLDDRISGLGFDEDRFEQLREQRADASTAYQQAESEYRNKSSELKHTEDKISGQEKQIEHQKGLKQQAAEKEEQGKYLSTLEKIMDNFKTSLISRIRPILSQYGSEFLMKLTQGKYSELSLDEDYEIHIFDSGEKYELKRFSGGEEDLANLSLRLAISRVIAESAGTTGMNMIILDEIFGSQDMYRKRNIISVLSELSNQYQQIFLITHIEDIKEHMGYVIDVKEDEEKNCSVVDVIG